VSRDRLLRDIREMCASFAAKYGRPMNSDEIRTLDFAEKLARAMQKPALAYLHSEWPPQCEQQTDDEVLVASAGV
jgi:hypothetical protein